MIQVLHQLARLRKFPPLLTSINGRQEDFLRRL